MLTLNYLLAYLLHTGVGEEEDDKSLDDDNLDDDNPDKDRDSSDEEPIPKKPTGRKSSKRERDLGKTVRMVLTPRIRGLDEPLPTWATLPARADDPETNMRFKEFSWGITEILGSQPHAWQIP